MAKSIFNQNTVHWLLSYGFVIALVISIVGKECFATDRIEGRKYYLALPGTSLTLTWRYYSSKMFKSVSITIPGSEMEDKKLWYARYDPFANKTKITKLNIANSLLNNITEFSIEKNKMLKLVIKAIPKRLSNVLIGCIVRQSKFETFQGKALVDVAVAPAVTISLKNGVGTHVPKGRDIEVVCSATGNPSPMLTIKKGDILRKKGISPDKAILQIKNVQPEDAGRYVCNASNIAGFQTGDAVVIVRYIDVEASAKSLMNLQSEKGKTELLQCPIEGYPAPMYSWLKYDIQNKEIRLGTLKELLLKITGEGDFGNYTCQGQNAAGVRKVVFSVTKKPTSSKRNSFEMNLIPNPTLAILMLVLLLTLNLK